MVGSWVKIKTLIFLHLLLLVYSCVGVFSKFAGMQTFLSVPFLFYYGVVLLILFVYAIVWQKIIKVLPLTTAFANKAVTIVWGIFLGAIIFGEAITLGKILGAILIILGIIFYTKSSNLDGTNVDE